MITEKIKTKNLLKQKKIKNYQLIEPSQLVNNLIKFKKGKLIIDKKTCSIFFENLLKKRFKIIKGDDPVYLLKSMKNNIEIDHMVNSHVSDGVALTKFLYWIKKLIKKITEVEAQKNWNF